MTFEGTEGSGKSTQIKVAADYLTAKGYKVQVLREPGGTRIGEAIREVILNKDFTEMTQETELLLYLAARAQIVREQILPAIKKGMVVICDRYEDSTLAYQGFGRGFNQATIKNVSAMIVRGKLIPNLTVLLNIDPGLGMKRGGRHDRMERESLIFHRRVQKGFLKLAKQNPKRFMVLDSSKSREEVAANLRKGLDRVFKLEK